MSLDNESDSESNKVHIPVMDFQDYQAQQSNIQSSRDDMFLDFEKTKRRFNQRKRHSIRPASNIRGNRTSTHTPLTPMEQIQIVRNSTLTPSGNNNNNNATFTDLQNHVNNKNNNDTPPPLNKPKSIPLIHENNNDNNKLPHLHSISQPPSPINDSNDAPINNSINGLINDNNNNNIQQIKRPRASSHRYSDRKSQTKTVGFYPNPPKIPYDNYTNQPQIRKPPNKKKKGVTFKPTPPPRKSAKQQLNPMNHNTFFKQRVRSQSDAHAHQREILYIRDDYDHNNSNGINNRPKSAHFSGSKTESFNTYQIPKYNNNNKKEESKDSDSKDSKEESIKNEKEEETIKNNDNEQQKEKINEEQINEQQININEEELKLNELKLREEELKLNELKKRRTKAAEIKAALARDLDNFQYDQWKKHCIAQTFSLKTLESAFKKYYEHNHVVLIKLYIVGYFFGNILVYAFYDIININNEWYRLITLFIRGITGIFLSIFGYLFWSKRLIEIQNDSMVIFNLFISIGALIVSGLGGEPGHGIFIIIMFCIHLFSGLGHLIASAICWFITFGFAVMSAIVTITINNNSNRSWYQYANTVSYLFLTAICLSLMGMFIEFSARRQFYQRKKLQHEKKKSWKALSTLLPPDVAKSLQEGKRVAVAFRYVQNDPKYRGVSVGFIQICDFHKLVSKLPSKNLVSMLNTIFTKWDEFASLHKVFKVETINEIYMIAGGLPYPKINENDYSHPIRMVFFANDIMNYCHQVLEVLVPETFKSQQQQKQTHNKNNSSRGMQFNYSRNNNNTGTTRPSLLPSTFKTAYQQKKQTITLKIRIGLNIGYVVAGVIGKKLPRYRLFGDTVNTASRMESTCKPSQIQMTKKFWLELPKVFHKFTQKRENVNVKGKGLMTTYLLNKIDRNKPIEMDYNYNNSQEKETIEEKKEEEIKEIEIIKPPPPPPPIIKPPITITDVQLPQTTTTNYPSNSNNILPQLSTIQETTLSGGFFGLITHTEEEEEESVMKTLTIPTIPQLKIVNEKEEKKEQINLNESKEDEPEEDIVTNIKNIKNININIRIDPPNNNENSNKNNNENNNENNNKNLLLEELKETTTTTTTTLQPLSNYNGNTTPISRMKSKRKMKLVGSKRNLFMDSEIQQVQEINSEIKDAYKQHRRNKSFKGLWTIKNKRISGKKKNKNKQKTKNIIKHKHNRQATPSHQRSKSTPFGPDNISNIIINESNNRNDRNNRKNNRKNNRNNTPITRPKTNSLALLKQNVNTPVSTTNESIDKKPHRIALKHKMTKSAKQKLTPTSNNIISNNISMSTNSSSSSSDSDSDSDSISSDSDSVSSNISIPSVKLENDKNTTKILVDNYDHIDNNNNNSNGNNNNSNNNSNNKKDKHALVVDVVDVDLFDDVVDVDGFGTDSDVMLVNIQSQDDSNTNIGRITPPAASTPSAQSSDQTGFSSSVDGQKRISSKHPPLESVPEIYHND